MAVPVDPFPDFVNGSTVADGDQVDARFKALYDALNPAQAGIDNSMVSPTAAIAGSKLADGSVTAAKVEAQQAWQTIALAGFTGNLAYYKDSLGIVHFRGDIQTVGASNTVSGATLATVPAGYRPSQTVYFTLQRLNISTTATVYVTGAGVVGTDPGLIAGGTYSFGQVSFRAEN